MTADDIVKLALRANSFDEFQELLKWRSDAEAAKLEAQRKFEEEAYFNAQPRS